MKKLFSILVALLAVMVACGNDRGYTSVDVGEFANYISDKNVQLIDVRTKTEFDEGHIPGAINIDVNASDFDTQLCQIADKGRPIALYCRSGRRSKIAAERVAAFGFDKIIELNSGFLSWTGKIER